MNKKNVLGYAVLALAFGAMGALVGLNQKDVAGPITTAYAATDGRPHTAVTNLFAQSLNDAGGKPQALSQWQGKPLLVNFWAPWCAPCVREMPELDALAKEMKAKQVNVIGIGIDSPANIAAFAARLKISYPLYVAGMGGTDLAREFGNEAGGLPYTVLIGADGQVKKTYLGSLKFDQLRADLAKL
ncbi:TlpA family protein disulfide reductase [Massilia solisilvae]|uniref:TlpA family protein disulfide reductase n=1 Tax=Massilia solisilvae TaxID=1811225 RepID=A0ABT2BDH6_9BURK|nr:TlpA disulfide reductase family protein [Massilia solisilvae]MCS0606581.1 TlpA family protein disulfide reductase [Massilia solisilvae]